MHFRGSYLELYLDGILSTSQILNMIGRDGALQFHLRSAESPLHYLVDSKTLFLSKTRTEIPNRNKKAWPITDARLTPGGFYEPDINHRIAIRDLGGVEAFNDFVEHLSRVEASKQEEVTQEAIAELKSLMRGHHIGAIRRVT